MSLLVLTLTVLSAGCGKGVGQAALPLIVALRNTPTPRPTPLPAPLPLSRRILRGEPLSALSTAVDSYLEDRSGAVGVAVVVPSRNAIYLSNGDTQFPLASVVKVAIMVATMDRAIREGRTLDSEELGLLDRMITVSDNDATTTLWTRLGGGEAIEACLLSYGVTDFHLDRGIQWGESTASPRAVALLLSKLQTGGILDEPSRTLALDLMSRVIPDQSWGVTAGLPRTADAGTPIGIKDGWYPSDDGWWVNSVGVVQPLAARPPYTIAVLTQNQPSLDYGIETIEWVAALIQSQMPGASPSAAVAAGW